MHLSTLCSLWRDIIFHMRTTLAALVVLIFISVVPVPARALDSTVTGIAGFAAGMSVSQILGLLTNSMTTKADAQCTPGNYTCLVGTAPPPGQPGPCMLLKLCIDETAGFVTTGHCITPLRCKAASTGAAGGASSGLGLDKVVGMLGQLAGQLLKGGSGSSASSPAATTPTTTGCPSGTYITNVVSSDPCAVFVPAAITGGTSALTNNNVTTDLLNALNGGSTPLDTVTATATGSSTTNILNQYSNGATQATIVSKSSSTTLNPVAGNVFAQSANLLPGVRGDISVLNNGATVVVNNRDQSGNTEVAGFYGGDSTLGTQPTGIIASWCQSRPWAKNFLSAIIPSTFFDSLCTLRGYTVGTPAPATTGQTQVSITQSPAQPVKTVATSTVSTVPLTVDIWASPATVSLGARTSVFWTSAGASSCTVTSPDGSFSQHTLTGGASTVAITSATVFTISCIAADGSHATKNVTVQIAI